MAVSKLDNYLRTYRKRSGFSQNEIGYLLGSRDGTKASRHEHFKRMPNLETALAYEAIFGVPVRELFAGISARAGHKTRRRARLLRKRLNASGRRSEQLLRLLGEVAPEHGQQKLAA